MTQGIYKIENKVNGKVYIGSSVDVQRRWQGHRSTLRGGYHANPHLQASWDKYGEDAFTFTVLEEVEGCELLTTEQRHLDEYFARGNCYNMTGDAAAPMLGLKHTEETKRKIGVASKGHVVSSETRRRMSEANMGQQNGLGYRHTDEARGKISKANKGKKLSNETKRKMSKAHKGHKHTEESRRKMSEARKRWWARKRLDVQWAKGDMQ